MAARVTSTSVQVAYYVLFALFPLIILIGNLLSRMGIGADVAADYVESILPDTVASLMDPLLSSLLDSSSTGLIIVSAGLFIWSASKSVYRLQNGINRAYGVSDMPSYAAKRVLSLITTALLSLLIFIFLVAFSFGGMVLEWLNPYFEWIQPVLEAVHGLRWPVMLVVVFCVLNLIYVTAADVKAKLRQVMPGSAFATVAILVVSELFSLYLQYANTYYMGYGAISSFIVLMIWLNFIAILVILGVIINAAILDYQGIELLKRPTSRLIDGKIVKRLRNYAEEKLEEHHIVIDDEKPDDSTDSDNPETD